MKHSLFLGILIFHAFGVFGQWATSNGHAFNTNSSGYVGIGTQVPVSRLTLNQSSPTGSGAQSSEITIQSNETSVARFGWNAGGYVDIRALFNNNHIALTPHGTGNVGIGTATPVSLLTLNRNGTGAQSSELTIQSNTVNVARFGWNAGEYIDISALYSNSHIVLSPAGTGKVGIGTTIPDAMLTVKGDIHTNEVRVDMDAPIQGPDYVFEKDYNLLSLAELEAYIDQNKHLPEVPSAKEMEANGLNLKEMNLLLLKKVEELTLHLIEQSHEIKKVNNENKELKERMSKLESKMK